MAHGKWTWVRLADLDINSSVSCPLKLSMSLRVVHESPRCFHSRTWVMILHSDCLPRTHLLLFKKILKTYLTNWSSVSGRAGPLAVCARLCLRPGRDALGLCAGFSLRRLLLLWSGLQGAQAQYWRLPCSGAPTQRSRPTGLAAPRRVGSSPTREQTRGSCIGWWILYR